MNETEPQDRPITTDPETDELADLVTRAEEGDEAAEVAVEEASGPSTGDDDDAAQASSQEVEQEAEPAPEDDVTDVPTEEATVLEAEAEEQLASDTIEGEDQGPLLATGPDRYQEEAAEVEVEVVEAPAETEAPSKEATEEAPKAYSPLEGPGDWYVVHTYAGY